MVGCGFSTQTQWYVLGVTILSLMFALVVSGTHFWCSPKPNFFCFINISMLGSLALARFPLKAKIKTC